MKYTFTQIEFISDVAEKIKEATDVLNQLDQSTDETVYLRGPVTGAFELTRVELTTALVQRRTCFLNQLYAMGIDIDVYGG